MSIEQNNIPKQEKGNQVDIVHKITLNSKAAAEAFFETAKQRLLNVSRWGEIAGGVSAEFELLNNNGLKVERPAQEGDHFKINVPAPGSDSGEGGDWVQVKSIREEENASEDIKVISMMVKPASNPQKPEQEIAHFFGDDASSTFVIKLKENTVSAEVHGRNEVPNFKGHGFWDTVRHTVVAIGAILGFSNKQWANLAEGLVNPKK